MTHSSDIHETYNILMDIVLHAEGNIKNHALYCETRIDYNQKNSIDIPSVLVPLLYAASNSVQMAVAFLPYYLKQYSVDNQSLITDLKQKIMTDDTWFTQEIYPQILKFLLYDSMRTFPVVHLNESTQTHNHTHHHIFLYDSECTHYPPYYGTNIHNLQDIHKDNFDDSEKKVYLVGNIQSKALHILADTLKSKTIYGITPYHQGDNQWQNWLHRRLNFFSKTILAGSLNMQLPFIEHYLQAGIAPFSFYHLLYRSKCPYGVIKNALCLLNNTQPSVEMSQYCDYQRVLSHTDLHILPSETTQTQETMNYLMILSCIP